MTEVLINIIALKTAIHISNEIQPLKVALTAIVFVPFMKILTKQVKFYGLVQQMGA